MLRNVLNTHATAAQSEYPFCAANRFHKEVLRLGAQVTKPQENLPILGMYPCGGSQKLSSDFETFTKQEIYVSVNSQNLRYFPESFCSVALLSPTATS